MKERVFLQHIKLAGFALLFGTLFSSCATIGGSGICQIAVSSVPDSVDIQVYDKKGQLICTTTTPDTLELRTSRAYFKRAEYSIQASKEGYQSKLQPLHFELNKIYISNVYSLFFMPVGFLLVDPISGAMWLPYETDLQLILQPEVGQSDQ